MKIIERNELLGLGDYEAIRPRFRDRVIQLKKRRRAKLGEHMSVVFENRDTMLLQIQEMLRAERITKESAIAHEMATYNELVPGEGELSMTLFIEVGDKAVREALLASCAGMESAVFLEIDGVRVPAVAADREGAREDRTTAVQYYKVPLGEAAAVLREGPKRVAVVVDHEAYRHSVELSRETVDELRGDLTWSE